MSDVVILLSGGVDSTVLLAQALAEGRVGLALWYRYAHPAAAAEYRACQAIQAHYGRCFPLMELTPPLFGLDATRIGFGQAGARVVPARNQVFVSVATAMAAARGFGEVWIGAQAADDADYPDCRPGWVAQMDALAQPWSVRVRAPLLGLSRQEVRARGAELGAPLHLATSCYQPGPDGSPCGTCNSCLQDQP